MRWSRAPCRPGRGSTSPSARGLEELAAADTVVVPSWDPDLPVPPELVEALRAAHARGARLVALCLGAFVLAATGLVDGREVTTHWHAAGELAARYPRIRVRSDVLWTDLGDVVSSAGTVAALDCCLHLVRTDRGAAVAAAVARRLVMPPAPRGLAGPVHPHARAGRRRARRDRRGHGRRAAARWTSRSTSTPGPAVR